MFKKIFFLLGAIFLFSVRLYAMQAQYGGDLLNNPTLSYSTAPSLDVSNLDTLAMQVTYASASISNFSFNDGSASTGNISVLNNNLLMANVSTNALTVAVSTDLTSGMWISVNGTKLVSPYNWLISTGSKMNTAISISTAINAAGLGVTASTNVVNGSTIVYIVANSSGVIGNSYTLSTSKESSLVPLSANFIGGRDPVSFKVNGVPFVFDNSSFVYLGSPVEVGASTTLTAKNISNAIVASPLLNSVIISSFSSSVVYATATASGQNFYTLLTSSAALLSVNSFTSGSTSAVSLSADTIYLPAHGITTGFALRYNTVTGSSLSGLTSGTTYYAIKVDDNYIKLSSTSAKSLNNDPVNITGQTAQGGDTFSLTPMPFVGTPSFKWQSSNDGYNWFDLPISSVTYSGASTTMWDGTINYRYLRLNYTAGTSGALNIKVTGYGKRYYP